MKFYKSSNGKWVIGHYTGVPIGTCSEHTNPATGVIMIRGNGIVYASDLLPTEFQKENGDNYADLAEYENATKDLFLKSTSSSGGGSWGEITGILSDQTDLYNKFQSYDYLKDILDSYQNDDYGFVSLRNPYSSNYVLHSYQNDGFGEINLINPYNGDYILHSSQDINYGSTILINPYNGNDILHSNQDINYGETVLRNPYSGDDVLYSYQDSNYGETVLRNPYSGDDVLYSYQNSNYGITVLRNSYSGNDILYSYQNDDYGVVSLRNPYSGNEIVYQSSDVTTINNLYGDSILKSYEDEYGSHIVELNLDGNQLLMSGIYPGDQSASVVLKNPFDGSPILSQFGSDSIMLIGTTAPSIYGQSILEVDIITRDTVYIAQYDGDYENHIILNGGIQISGEYISIYSPDSLDIVGYQTHFRTIDYIDAIYYDDFVTSIIGNPTDGNTRMDLLQNELKIQSFSIYLRDPDYTGNLNLHIGVPENTDGTNFTFLYMCSSDGMVKKVSKADVQAWLAS